jgi:hypothetical protein
MDPQGPMNVVAVEDLVARTTSLLVWVVWEGVGTLDVKHARDFRRLV